jgi:hypothetical protein
MKDVEMFDQPNDMAKSRAKEPEMAARSTETEVTVPPPSAEVNGRTKK